MANIPNTHDTDSATRANLAYFWSIVTALILGYIVIKWGSEKEILTLIIGLVGGTIIGGIFGIYFGGSLAKKTEPIVNAPGDSPNITVNPAPTIDETKP